MRKLLRHITIGDGVLCAILLGFAALLMVTGSNGRSGANHVVVEVSGVRTLELSLDSDVSTTVHGPRGDTAIDITGGKVRITESACPHKLCTRMGPITHSGEVIICVPNQVFVTIRGTSGDLFDGVTQ